MDAWWTALHRKMGRKIEIIKLPGSIKNGRLRRFGQNRWRFGSNVVWRWKLMEELVGLYEEWREKFWPVSSRCTALEQLEKEKEWGNSLTQVYLKMAVETVCVCVCVFVSLCVCHHPAFPYDADRRAVSVGRFARHRNTNHSLERHRRRTLISVYARTALCRLGPA